MPFINIAASRIYFEEHGAGPPMVLLHGVGGNHASWFQQVETLGSMYRLVIMDARGFGNSVDGEGIGRDAFVDDLEALLDHLGIAQAILVAQSMGGGTALEFTCRFAHRVAALCLADTLIGFRLPEAVAPEMERVARSAHDLSQPERVLGVTTRTESPIMARLYTTIASFNSVNFRTLKGAAPSRAPEELEATGVPTLFIVGEEDILFPPDLVAAVQQRVAGSRLVRLPRAGHSAFYETPEAFDAALTNWLGGLGLAARAA